MARGRPRKSDPDKVLEQALALFWKHGFAATSMNDISRETGMAKPGLYAQFGSKEELFEKALRHYYSQFTRGNGAAFTKSTQPIDIAVRHLLENTARDLLAQAEACGCFLVNTLTETAGGHAGLAALSRELADDRNKILLARIERAQSEGELSTDIPAHQIADFLAAQLMAIGALVSEGADRGTIDGVIDLAMAALPSAGKRPA